LEITINVMFIKKKKKKKSAGNFRGLNITISLNFKELVNLKLQHMYCR